jgi:aspartate/methionine/tyrosine aminotransferase
MSHSMPSRAVTDRTKIIVLNTPHNPLGKVFTRAELEGIAAIAKEFNLLVMSDEVVRCHCPETLAPSLTTLYSTTS